MLFEICNFRFVNFLSGKEFQFKIIILGIPIKNGKENEPGVLPKIVFGQIVVIFLIPFLLQATERIKLNIPLHCSLISYHKKPCHFPIIVINRAIANNTTTKRA